MLVGQKSEEVRENFEDTYMLDFQICITECDHSNYKKYIKYSQKDQ